MLEEHSLALCGGWYSGTLLGRDLSAEKDQVHAQLELFRDLDAPCLVYGETHGTIQNVRHAPLNTRIRLDDDQVRGYGRQLTEFAEWCAEEGMPISFHHHMGTAVESMHDVDRLMNWTGEAVRLLYDPGHMAFAGGDVLEMIERHSARISHFHAKDVRRDVIDRLDRGSESFLDAVLKGAFTVPGDGSLDFHAIIDRLDRPATKAGSSWKRSRIRDWRRRRNTRSSDTRRSCRHLGMQDTRFGKIDMNRLDGKIAVVTGSTQGLGLAIARRFANSGAAGLVTCGRSSERGREAAAGIERGHRGPGGIFHCRPVQC